MKERLDEVMVVDLNRFRSPEAQTSFQGFPFPPSPAGPTESPDVEPWLLRTC